MYKAPQYDTYSFILVLMKEKKNKRWQKKWMEIAESEKNV